MLALWNSLPSSDCHFDLFTAEVHTVFINRPDPGGRQLGLVFLVVDLLQGRLGQLFQLLIAAIFLRFQLDQEPGSPFCVDFS